MVFGSPIDVQFSERDRVQPHAAWWSAGVYAAQMWLVDPPARAITGLRRSTKARLYDVIVKRGVDETCALRVRVEGLERALRRRIDTRAFRLG